MDFRKLIHDMGVRIGFENLEPDENNVCHLISDEMAITIEWPDYYNCILMSATVCDIPADRRNDVELFRALAQANFLYRKTYGSTISVDPKSERVHIFRYDRAWDWTVDDLLYVVGRVAQGVMSIRKLVGEYGAKDALPKENDTYLPASGFLIV